MTTPNSVNRRQAALAKRNEALRARKEAYNKSSSSTSKPSGNVLFIAQSMRFEPSDTTQTNGVLCGYQPSWANDGTKRYVEFQIKPSRLERNQSTSKKDEAYNGGIFNMKLNNALFGYTTKVGVGANATEKQMPSIIYSTSNNFNKEAADWTSKMFPENVGTDQKWVLVQGAEYKGSREETIDGEQHTVYIYQCSWVRAVRIGSQLSGNFDHNALLTIEPQYLYARSQPDENGKRTPIKKIGASIKRLLVWETNDKGAIDLVRFSNAEGLEQAFGLCDEAERLNDMCITNSDEFTSEFANKVYEGAQYVSFAPVFMFGIVVPTTEEEQAKNNGRKNKVIYTQRYVSGSKTRLIEFDAETGEPLWNDDDVNYPYQCVQIEKTDGTTADLWTTMNRSTLAENMLTFKEQIINAELNSLEREALQKAYPDLDIDNLTDDNFFIMSARAYNYNRPSRIKEQIEILEKAALSLADATGLSDKVLAEQWNGFIEAFYANTKYTDREFVKLYNWDGTPYERENEFTSYLFNYALRGAPIVDTSNFSKEEVSGLMSFGVLSSFKGFYIGSSWTSKDNKVSFYPTISNSFGSHNRDYSRNLLSFLLDDNEVNEEGRKQSISVAGNMYQLSGRNDSFLNLNVNMPDSKDDDNDDDDNSGDDESNNYVPDAPTYKESNSTAPTEINTDDDIPF